MKYYKIQMAETQDPLRFLNIKRKRQQNKKHTPHKRLTEKSLSESSQLVLPSFTSLNSMEQHHKITYNPFKYFSEEIENFLNSEQEQSKQMTFAKDQQKMRDLKKEMNNLEMMTFSRENKRRLFDEFAQEEKQQKSQNDYWKANLLQKQKQTQKEFQNGGKRKNIQVQEFNIFEGSTEQNNENPQANQQLRQCQICQRKFNPVSYEKHVRVCDRVFKQKRKPFRSRSTSLEGNDAKKN